MIYAIHWLMIAFMTLGVLATISIVGQPRKPLTPGVAAAVTLINGFFVFALLMEVL